MNHPSSSSHSSSSSSLFLMQQESSRSQASSPFFSTNNNYPSMATSPARSSAPNSLHGTPKALSPPRGPSGVSAWVSSTDESSKYRQLPCKTFISVGACPYRDRCVYLHDPRIKVPDAKTKTRRKNKEDSTCDAFFWPVMDASSVRKNLDVSHQPAVVQPYTLPSFNPHAPSNHDRSVYSMWMHFVEFCGTNPILGVGDAIEDNAASSQLVNRYTCRARLPVFVALAKGKHSQGDGEEEGRLSFALKEGHQHRGAGHHELLAPSFEDSRARYYSTPVRPSVEQQAPSLAFPLLVGRSYPSPAGLPLGPSPSTVATDLEAMLSSSSSLNSPSLDWNCFPHFDERNKSLTNDSLRGSRSDRADRVDSSRGTFQNLSPKPEKEFLTALFSNGSLWQRSL